ncbi:MAG TPA: ATP-binding cassette domain-containing protein [Pyrinomonadaceae bacterium]|nr:ATP-binding cassette domain-containing protein [Pyrinomonadaceae bacterium]
MASTNADFTPSPASLQADNQASDAESPINKVDEKLGESGPAVPAIEFRNVSFSFEDKKVLDDISFIVKKAEIKIVLSGSGGGKSTILKLILGLLKPDEGQIFVDGDEITNYDETEMQRVRELVGMVFQEGALFDSLSVYDNVAYRLQEHEVPEEDIEREVRLLLRFVDLEDEMDKMPIELSGGMQKRVSIARALVGDPKIVLFDEPTVGLDPPTAAAICELIIKLRDLEDVSSILVTHEMDVVKYITTEYAVVSDEGEIKVKEEGDELCLINTNILMLHEGRVIFSGPEEELVKAEDPYIQEFIHGTEIKPDDAEQRATDSKVQ